MFGNLKKELKVKAKAMGNVGKEKVSGKFADLKKKSQELYEEYKEEERKIRGEMNTSDVDTEEVNVLVAYYNDDNRVVKSNWHTLKEIVEENEVDLMRIQEKTIDGVTYPVLYKKF